MGSFRLPGKVLKPVGKRTLLGHILQRLKFLRHKALIIVATTDLKQDDVIEKFCRDEETNIFRGSEKNVLQRYFQCAELYKLEHIIRLTGDNPFTDIEELDRLIDLYFDTNSDFCHSFSTLPIGTGAEIFSFNALSISMEEASKEYQFEHVDEYMLEHPEKFKTSILKVSKEKHFPDIRMTVDDNKDYQKACAIMKKTNQAETASIEEAISFCMHSV